MRKDLIDCVCGATQTVYVMDNEEQVLRLGRSPLRRFTASTFCTGCERKGPRFESRNKREVIADAVAGWNYQTEQESLRAENERLRQQVAVLERHLKGAQDAAQMVMDEFRAYREAQDGA